MPYFLLLGEKKNGDYTVLDSVTQPNKTKAKSYLKSKWKSYAKPTYKRIILVPWKGAIQFSPYHR